MFETFGLKWYSRPALNDIDRKLEKYLDWEGGFFIEAGANNGFTQSNTYFLERFKRWRGILVEPMPQLYEKCVKERPLAMVFNCALVSNDHKEKNITMFYSNLMSIVKGSRKSEAADIQHLQKGISVQKDVVRTFEVEVSARTLTSILEETGVDKVDFVSLDVEGFELSVLQGLDLDKYRPKYLLIEADFKDEIDSHLSSFGYQEVDRLSYHDVLYKSE